MNLSIAFGFAQSPDQNYVKSIELLEGPSQLFNYY